MHAVPPSPWERLPQYNLKIRRSLMLWAAFAVVLLTYTGYKYTNFNETQDKEAAEKIVQLVLSMTNMTEPSSIRLMRETLETTKTTLTSLYEKIKKFERNLKFTPDSTNRSLPVTVIGTDIGIKYSEFWQGHRLPVIGGDPNGRLGNVMGEYATLFALRELFNASSVLTEQHRQALVDYFPNLSLPRVSIWIWGSWEKLNETDTHSPFYSSLQLAALGLLGPRRFLSTGFPFEVQLFNEHAEKIRKEFTFSENIVKKAEAFLTSVKQSAHRTTDESLTFVGVHVRLTDYPIYIKRDFDVVIDNTVYKNYIQRSIQYYNDRFNNTVFIVASDNRLQAEQIFKATGEKNFFVAKGTPAEDMCLLSLCNHSIITVGSYGFWTGYLNRGTTVYANVVKPKGTYIFSKPFFEVAQLDNFIPLPLLA